MFLHLNLILVFYWKCALSNLPYVSWENSLNYYENKLFINSSNYIISQILTDFQTWSQMGGLPIFVNCLTTPLRLNFFHLWYDHHHNIQLTELCGLNKIKHELILEERNVIFYYFVWVNSLGYMLFDVWYGLKEGFPGSLTGKESACNAGDLDSWVRKIPWRRDRLPTPVFLGFPGGSDGLRICLYCGRPGFQPWVGKILWRRAWQPTPVLLPGESHGQIPSQNPRLATVHGVAKSWTQLSD